MKKIAAYLSHVVVAVLVVVLVAELTLLLVNWQTRRRAESLLDSLRRLKVGESTLEDAQPILVAFEAEKSPTNCSLPGDGYSILVSNGPIGRLGAQHPLLLRAGIRPLGVAVTMSFAGGRLCEFQYQPSVILEGSQLPWKNKDLTAEALLEISAGTAIEVTNTNQGSKHENYDISYFHTLLRGFRPGGTHLGLRVRATPKATSSELERALTFDLSCFTSFRGCRTFCQMMPLVSQDALQRHKREGLPMPEDEIEFPGCSAVYREYQSPSGR